jgi:hypothetical protein
MIQESVLHEIQHLFRSYEAPVYQEHSVWIDERPIKIRRKIQMMWTRKEVVTKAIELLPHVLEGLHKDQANGLRSMPMEPIEKIRLGLNLCEADKERIEKIVTSKLLYAGSFDYFD